MGVSELVPTHFESESPGRVWVSRTLARARACWPGATSLGWPGVGQLSLSVSAVGAVEPQHAPSGTACESFALWRGGRQGRLDVDARFSVGLTSRIRGQDDWPLPRTLSPAERGMMVGLVGATLDHFGAPLQVALDVPDAVPLRLDVQVELDLRFDPEAGAGLSGWARVFLPSAWLDARAVCWPRLRTVPFPVVLERARTQILRASLSSLRPGDALVFGGEPAPGIGGASTVWLCVGAFRAPARAEGDVLRLSAPFEPAPGVPEWFAASPVAPGALPWKGTAAMSNTIEMSPSGAAAESSRDPVRDAPSASLAQALANTPVEVVAEVGRVVLTGAELAGLEGGQVLALGPDSRGPVTLTVAGRPVAKGLLVNVDGVFGVRVTERV